MSTAHSSALHASSKEGTCAALSPCFKEAEADVLTLSYKDAAGKDQAAVFELGKDIVRTTLKIIETQCGKDIQFQDDDAQKAIGGGTGKQAALHDGIHAGRQVVPKRPPILKARRRSPSPIKRRLAHSGVLARLDTHERLLSEVKSALDIQFTRIAEIQAQLDQLLTTIEKGRGSNLEGSGPGGKTK
jgi:hypothetical protein